MCKRNYIKIAIFMIIIIFIFLTFFYTFEMRNKQKKFVTDIYEGYIILTDDEGRNITDEIKESYQTHFEAGEYELIYSKIKDYVYTTYYDKENNKLKISN